MRLNYYLRPLAPSEVRLDSARRGALTSPACVVSAKSKLLSNGLVRSVVNFWAQLGG